MTPERAKGLKNNKKILFFTRFFLELKSLNGVIQLFYLSRGLDISQIILLSLIWSATILVTDVPSSFLADKFGRKRLIIAGIVLSALGLFLLFFVHGFIPVAISYIISAAGYSFFGGADQAILYDSLKELGEEQSSTRVSGKYFSAASLPKIIIPFIGSLIAKNLLPLQFLVLVGIDFSGTLAAIITAFKFTEPNRHSDILELKFGILKDGIDEIVKNPVILKLTLNKILTFEAAFIFWRVYQVLLKNNGVEVIYLGLIYTLFQGIMFLVLWNVEQIQKKIGEFNFALIPQIVGLFSVTICLLTKNPIILFTATVFGLTVGTLRDPFFLAQIQKRLTSFNRATTTSTLNTIKNIMDIPILLGVGYLASIDIKYVLVSSAALFVGSMILTPITNKDLLT